MKNILLYVLAGLMSISAWTYMGTYLIPFLAWVIQEDIDEFAVFLFVFVIVCAVLHFIVLLVLSIVRRKRKNKVNRYKYLPLYIVPLAITGLSFYLADDKYSSSGRWICNGNYYEAWHEGVVYDKFGKKILSHSGRMDYKGRYIYMYDNDWTGSIYDTSIEDYILMDTNLKYGGEKFEEDGRYGIELNSNGIIIVQPIYESIKFLDSGAIVVERNGKYGLLDPLGRKLEDCNNVDIEDLWNSNTGGGTYIKIREKERTEVHKLLGNSDLRHLVSTEYDVITVYSDDRFEIERDEGDSRYPYAVIDDNGNNVYGAWYNEIRYDEDKDVFEARHPTTHNWFDMDEDADDDEPTDTVA